MQNNTIQMAQQFEDTITRLGYKIIEEPIICQEPGWCYDSKDHSVYKQDCSCCCIDYPMPKPKPNDVSRFFGKMYRQVINQELPWIKISACQECLDAYLDSLVCGGHYTHIRIFNPREDITCDYNIATTEINPQELVYPDWGT